MVYVELRYFLCTKGGEVDIIVDCQKSKCIGIQYALHIAILQQLRRNLELADTCCLEQHHFKTDTDHACEIKSTMLQTPVVM